MIIQHDGIKDIINEHCDWDWKTSQPALSDLYNYVQMGLKTTKKAKIMKIIHQLSRYLWKLFNCGYHNLLQHIVYGGDISGFHFFEALNDYLTA